MAKYSVRYANIFIISLLVQVKGAYLLNPLGYNNPPIGNIASLDQLNSNSFYDQYVSQNQPVIIKDLLADFKPLKWTDEYLRNRFGDLKFDVDNKKVDDRSSGRKITMKKFLSIYKHSSFEGYMISTLPKLMRNEFPVPNILSCDIFLHRMQDYVLWFSSGDTKSKLHFDNVENVYCQLFGVKKWFMVEPKHGNMRIPLDRPEGQYCDVNVSSVDFEKYPGLQNIEWWNATLNPGDCLYVPYNWWHQVNSMPGKNMAVNIWFAPLFLSKSKKLQCNESKSNQYLGDLKFNYGEWFRFVLLEMLLKHGGKISTEHIKRIVLHEHTNRQLFTNKRLQLLDINRDGILEIKELEFVSSQIVHESVKYSEIGAVFVNESKAVLSTVTKHSNFVNHDFL